ncbi:MAG: glycine cleavage system protein H [Deltaproteobacteria bacterium]|nr:glycine cleavage system protein H [Deltaproteobacteria bacterium]
MESSANKNQLNSHPDCLWMQAGVVPLKLCKSGYDCKDCRFDRAMRRTASENMRLKWSGSLPGGKRGKIIPWKDKLKALPAAKRPCIHHMKGRIEFRACTHEYQCGNCDFDQFFDDQYSVHAVVRPVDFLNIKGFRIPQGYYFHRGHTWVKIEEGSEVRVGVDDFALRLLGPLDRIEAPLMGKEVKQGRADISAVRGNHQVKFSSPVNGIVTSINPRLRELGSLANQDPYTEGWVMRVQADRLRRDLKGLMINEETGTYFNGHVEQLYNIIEEVSGPLATDGGDLGSDIFGSMPEIGWERLTKTFLNT